MTPWQIVGAMHPAVHAFGFARAALVLQRDSRLVIARQIRGEAAAGEAPAGEVLDEGEWRELQEAEEGFALRQHIPAFPQAGIWLLGEYFEDKDAAVRELDALDACRATERHGRTTAMVVDEGKAAALREQWAQNAFDRAKALVQAGEVEAACRAASLAFELPAHFVDDYVAMLALAWELRGDKARAEAYLTMMHNSRAMR